MKNPLSFLRQRLRKTVHNERVTVQLHPVHCACRSVWYATPGLSPVYDRCPECSAPARAGTIGPLEPVEVDVPLQTDGLLGQVLVRNPLR